MNRPAEQLSLPGVVPDSKRSQGRRRRWTWIAITAVALVAAPAVARDLGIDLIGLGTVTPLNTVTVRTRVDGELLTVRYRQGQMVSKGELLAEIDPRPFQAQLTQFEGQLARDEALLENGRVELRLVDPGNIVHATDTTGIVVITQLQPITVIFTLPEDNIGAVVDRLGRGERLVVDAYDRAQQRKLASGSLVTIDNQIDTTT